MTPEDEGKEKAIRYYRILAVVLGILGAVLLALGVVAVVKQSNYEGDDTFGLPYFVGGFLVGIMSLASAAVCTCVLVKAPDANSDVKKKELACAMVGHYMISMFMFMGCFVGTVLAGVGGFSDNIWYVDVDDEYYKTKQKLAIAILVLCIITLFVTIFSLCVVCTYGSYFGVAINNRRGRTVILASTGGTGVTGIVHPAPYTMGTTANNDQIRQLELQNRLLQQQLELQRQQQQNQYSGGLYPPPPPANYGFGVGPSAPPPSYDSLR